MAYILRKIIDRHCIYLFALGRAKVKYGGFDKYLIEHYFYCNYEPIRSLLVSITCFNDIFMKSSLIINFSKFYT